MATLTIRNVDDEIKAKIREQAARHGVSMEEEVRRILRRAVIQSKAQSNKNMMTLIRERLAERGLSDKDYVELEIPSRNDSVTRPPVDFSDYYPELEDEEE